MPVFRVGGVSFHYVDIGSGMPFVFQHGIGGSVRQPVDLFSPPHGVRLLSFDARAHGQTEPLGDPDWLTFDTFGDDLVALLDHLALSRAIVGGISMGAGLALNVAARYPDRVAGLVLSRPAWLDGPMPADTVALYDYVAYLLRNFDTDAALRQLGSNDAFRLIAARFPDPARSLRAQITEPRAVEAVARLERLPRDRPIADLRVLSAVQVPTLVLAHEHDPLHPLEFGHALARAIPGSRLVHLTPKSVDRERHAADVQHALARFLEPSRWQQATSRA